MEAKRITRIEMLIWALSDKFAVRYSNEVVCDVREKCRGVDEQLERFEQIVLGSLSIANDLFTTYHETGSVPIASRCFAGGKQFLSHAAVFQSHVMMLEIQRKRPFKYSVEDEEYEQALEELPEEVG